MLQRGRGALFNPVLKVRAWAAKLWALKAVVAVGGGCGGRQWPVAVSGGSGEGGCQGGLRGRPRAANDPGENARGSAWPISKATAIGRRWAQQREEEPASGLGLLYTKRHRSALFGWVIDSARSM